MTASGVRTAEEFEICYSKASGEISLSRGLWSRYLRGEVIPQGARASNQRSLIDRMDDEHQGSADIFVHPLWDLLDFDLLLGPDQLKRLYLWFDENIWRRFVACGHSLQANSPPVFLTFWQIQRSETERRSCLGRLDGLDGLAACLIEARLGYMGQDEDRFVGSFSVAAAHFKKLGATDVFSSTRMRSSLLLMEGLCVAYVTRKTVDAPTSDEAHSLQRSKARHWQSSWLDRYKSHMKQLSPSSEATFRRWAKLAFGLLTD